MSVIDKAQARASDPLTVELRLKSDVEEILRAYRHSWDVYSELIQNSVDAINRRFRILNDPDFYLYNAYRERFPTLESDTSYTGRICINLNVSERTVEVWDNGVGIHAGKIEEFLLPKGSDKSVSNEYGFKGYGLTFVGFISEEFYIASRPFFPIDSDAHELQLNGLFNWLTNENRLVPFPTGPIQNTQLRSVFPDDWNTIVKVKLADDYSIRFPAVSSADKATNLAETGLKRGDDGNYRPKGFEYILRTRTAIGNTRPLFNRAPIVAINVTLNIITTSGISVNDVNIPYRYYHPREHEEVLPASYDFEEYVENLKKAHAEREFRVLYHTVENVQIGTRRTLQCNIALGAISSTRLSNIEADLELDSLDTGDIDISYGIHLAIDGMPTGLRIDDWDMRGHNFKRYFVVVDADMDISNQLDPGRKGISRYYAGLISEKVVELLGSQVNGSSAFSHYAGRYLNHGRGREEGGLPPQDFLIKVNQAREEQANDGRHNAELAAKIRAFSSLTRIPRDEQEVIALYYELRAKNIIKGYNTVYLSGKSVYDAAFDYEIDCQQGNIFPADPLGLGQVLVQDLRNAGQTIYRHRNHYAGVSTHPELCVDYKRTLGAFLEEVIRRPGTSNKDPNLIDLLIVWSVDVPTSVSSTLYTLDLLQGNRRIFHGVTHRIGLMGQYNTELWCISLENVLAALGLPQ